MRISFFEDAAAGQLNPLSLMRPVFELTCGQFSLRERMLRTQQTTQWGCLLRTYLAETYGESFPESYVNDLIWLCQDHVILINGRWLPDVNGLAELSDIGDDEVWIIDGIVAAMKIEPAEASILTIEDWDDGIGRIARTRSPRVVGGVLVDRPWDLVNHNAKQLIDDFQLRGLANVSPNLPGQVGVLGDPEDIFIHSTAQLDPFVVIDAQHGPVSIDAGARIQAFTRLEGPCHIGRESQLFRANIREGTTIGPVCRVGGEVEESILHGYVNKYHDGFLGHSYVCPWVNLGALTSNSDLKNDYSNVRVPLGGEAVDSGLTKVGCFIGDHTKTALTSLFNTGTSVGVQCMVLPGGELLPKHIPSFCRIWHGHLDDNSQLTQCVQTARTAMERRNVELTSAQERLLRYLYEATTGERVSALERVRQREVQTVDRVSA